MKFDELKIEIVCRINFRLSQNSIFVQSLTACFDSVSLCLNLQMCPKYTNSVPVICFTCKQNILIRAVAVCHSSVKFLHLRFI